MKHDAIVAGGGFAGLAAATYLARARRSVRVLDTGKPRNRFTDESHGFLGHDGSDPRLILASARRQLLAYPTAEVSAVGAMTATAIEGGFRVGLVNGEEIEASKLILAFGLRDELPAIPGLEQRWGKTVLHCPYCHGIEFSDQRLGVLYRVPMSVHQACLIAEWGPTTLFLNGASLSHEDRATLARRGVAVEPAPVVDEAPSRQFDGATCLLTLHFLEPEERLRVLRAIRQRLKPGSTLVVAHHSYPHSDGPLPWLTRSVAFGSKSEQLATAAAPSAAAMVERLPLLSDSDEERLLGEAGYSDVSLFYAAFSFRGWSAIA